VTRPDDPGETAADLAFLRRVLNEWDLYGLIGMGAPEDEFDSKRDRIYGVLKSGGGRL
jgi:hypothetical protein